MTNTGMSKKIDALGRVVIPKELRISLGLEIGSTVNFYVENDNLIISRIPCSCAICGEDGDFVDIKGKKVCTKCLEALKEIDESEAESETNPEA